MKFRTCSIFAFFLLIWHSTACAQNEASLDKDHIVGLYEAHRSHIESLRSGDVLIKVDVVGNGHLADVKPGPDSVSVVTQTTSYIRYVFDFDNRKLFVVNRREQHVDFFDALSEQIGATKRGTLDRSGIFDLGAKTVLVKMQAATPVDMSGKDRTEEMFLLRLGVPQIFGFGCSTEGLYEVGSLAEVYNCLERFGHPDAIEKIENIGRNRYRVFSSLVLEGSAAGGVRTETDWDVKNQVPIKFVHFAGPKPDPSKKWSLKPIHTSIAEWKKIEGYFLPILCRGSYKGPGEIEDVEFDVDYEVEMQLHWFSINGEVADKFFDPKILEDVPKLAELTDPEYFESTNGGSNR